MIMFLAASSITLTALQASINAPRDAFKTCLKQAQTKAATEKVGADAYGAYVRTNCSSQLGSFKGAVVKFDMGNKMSKKASDEDADAMVADFVSGSLDHYKYLVTSDAVPKQNASAPAGPAPSAVTPPPIPASQPK